MFWEKKTKIRKHIIFYGRVQGVGFRYYAVQKANQLGPADYFFAKSYLRLD